MKCQNQLIYGLTIEAYAKLSSVLKDDTKLSTEALECIHENFESEKVTFLNLFFNAISNRSEYQNNNYLKLNWMIYSWILLNILYF